MAAKKTETPTAEEILLQIYEEIKRLHTTLGNGLLAIQKAALAGSAEEIPEPHPGTNEPGKIDLNPGAVNVAKEEKAPETDDIPKFIREWIVLNPGCTAADVMKEHKISENRARAAVKLYGKPAPAKEPKKEEKVTVEMLRKRISEFADRFSMNEALAVNEQFGGSRKVSGIPESSYEKVFNVMGERLKAQDDLDAAKEKKEPEKAPTIDDVRAVAKPFVDKNGDPAFRALLKAVGKADKISGVDPSLYPVLIEALSNA